MTSIVQAIARQKGQQQRSPSTSYYTSVVLVQVENFTGFAKKKKILDVLPKNIAKTTKLHLILEEYLQD